MKSILPHPISDRSSILLEVGGWYYGIRRGPTSFRFENTWLREERFSNLLKGWWMSPIFTGSTNFVLASLKGRIKRCLEMFS